MLDTKRNKTLNICVVISFLTHTIFLVVLQSHTLWFSAPLKSEIVASTRSQILEKVSPDELLKEAFSPRKVARELPLFTPEKEVATFQFKESPILMDEPPLFSLPSMHGLECLAAEGASFPIRSFQLPSPASFNFLAELPKDLIFPTQKKMDQQRPFQPQIESVISKLITEKAKLSERTVAFVSGEQQSPQVEVPIARVVPKIPVPNLPQLPSLAELETVNLSDSFDSELSFLPRSDGPGYIFALTLIPRADLNIPKIRQNVIFLIDRSNSIQRDRLQASKHAVSRALEELDSDIHFNVIAFDSKLDKLFPSLIPQSTEAIAKADRFMEKISLGSLFSVGDLHKALFLTIPNQVENDELYTAILLTDGENLSKKSTQRALFRDWTLQNNGRVSLYAIGIEGDPNLATLDATCAMNQGKLISSTTNRGLKRKLIKLTKNIRSPIAKRVSSRAVAQSSMAHVNIHLSTPNIYLDEPYVILGSTESLDDFILFVQANLKTGWVNIKKSISFTNAKKGGESLRSQWALQHAYRQYEQFILDENPSHLAEARKLLEPFDIQAIQ